APRLFLPSRAEYRQIAHGENACAPISAVQLGRAVRASARYLSYRCGRRNMCERSNVKLVRIFHRDFGFIGNRLGHDEGLLQITETIRFSPRSGLIWINPKRTYGS